MPLWAPTEPLVSYYAGTELAGLPNTSFSAVGAAVTNSTARYPYIMFELLLGSLSPTAGAAINIWVDYSIDTTNFSDPAKPLQVTSFLTSAQLDTAASTAQRLVWAAPLLYPFDFKLQVENKSNVALASGSGSNTLKYSRFYM